MAWLNRELAQWELYEVGAGSEDLEAIDTADQGNLKMRLVHAFNPEAAMERAQDGLARILRLLPPVMRSRVTIAARSANEVTLSLYGLEFARVRQGFVADSFVRQCNLTFGAGANETPLQEDTEAFFADLMQRLFASRYPEGSARDPLFRLQPEAWLRVDVGGDLTQIDDSLGGHIDLPPGARLCSSRPRHARSAHGYAQRAAGHPGIESGRGSAFSAPGLGLLDSRALAAAAAQLHRRGRAGAERLFPGIPLLPHAPLLYYIVPALRVHPSMDTVLQHLSPAIPWTLVALNEGWRTEPKSHLPQARSKLRLATGQVTRPHSAPIGAGKSARRKPQIASARWPTDGA